MITNSNEIHFLETTKNDLPREQRIAGEIGSLEASWSSSKIKNLAKKVPRSPTF